jgi:hypothetical protein
MIVRNNFIEGVKKRDDPVDMNFIFLAYKRIKTTAGKRSLALLIPSAKEDKNSFKFLKKLLKEMDPDIRKTIYLSIFSGDSEFWKKCVKKYSKKEPLADLKQLITKNL